MALAESRTPIGGATPVPNSVSSILGFMNVNGPEAVGERRHSVMLATGWAVAGTGIS